MITKQNYIVATPDERLRLCSQMPVRRPTLTQGDVSALLVELFSWGTDCAGKLKATWESIDDAKARAIELNKKEAE